MSSSTVPVHPQSYGAPAAARRRRHSRARAARRPAWQRWLVRGAGLLFLVSAAWLLAAGMRELDWHEILLALRRFTWTTVFAASGIALLGYAVSSVYDLLCRHYEQHHVSTPRVLSTGFVSLAFSMNLGSLVGGWGMRYRLYSRFGLPMRQITRIICLALMSNWSGFVLLAGLIFTFMPPALPARWPVHGDALVIIGVVLLLCCAAYLVMCAHGRGRSWRIRGVRLRRPSLGFAGMQLALSSASWIAMALVLNCFLPQQITLVQILGVLFVSSIAGLIVRVPAGLGVLEAVFVTLLGHQAGASAVMAGLLAFRATYYLLPLLVALAMYGVLELRSKPAQRGGARSLQRPAA